MPIHISKLNPDLALIQPEEIVFQRFSFKSQKTNSRLSTSLAVSHTPTPINNQAAWNTAVDIFMKEI